MLLGGNGSQRQQMNPMRMQSLVEQIEILSETSSSDGYMVFHSWF
jgi:hypothetical protein